jgi:hypothetical protein
VRIPRRVNTVLDWLSRNAGRPVLKSPLLLACCAAPVCALVAVLVSPTASFVLAAFFLGMLCDWARHGTHLARTERALDDSEYEVGRLRHENAQLRRGRVAENTLETHVLPRIGGDNS